ncbi:ubiquitin-related domain-containing protein [Suillus clintonianus]|uniref:ubiquitin-related domain-containing protein n=1 Tax=Suillus clintonianus TaxID=1904413 RepID=UPI001B86BED8|nr:ubiquitin-related domain-containing protein [Suillus clintonianus]KAG2123237.1 ubiquitin-related domain-containing protein [Suillus clintonianus]
MAEEQQQNSQGQEDFKQEDNAPINVKVVSSTGDEVFFKIKRNTKLSKLQGAYATKVGKDVGSIRFLYDGSRINDDDTPASLDMEDNDTIDVMVERAHSSSFFIAFLIFGLIILFLDMQRLAVHLLHICTVVAHNCNTTVYSISLPISRTFICIGRCLLDKVSLCAWFWRVMRSSFLKNTFPRHPLSALLLSAVIHVCRRCRIFSNAVFLKH